MQRLVDISRITSKTAMNIYKSQRDTLFLF